MTSSKSPYCDCGCGERTTQIKHNVRTQGLVAGQYRRFVKGHAPRVSTLYKRRRQDERGRWTVYRPDHPRAVGGRYVFEHILVAEAARGRPLPPGAVIHHVNEDCSDNRPENLVVCENQRYHILLHVRTRAFRASGNAGWRICKYCSIHDDPSAMRPNGREWYHLRCRREHQDSKRTGLHFKCVACGNLTAGRKPRRVWHERPDGTFYYPRRHRLSDGTLCAGSFEEAEWVTL